MKGDIWTEKEEELLKEIYFESNKEELQKYFPTRKITAIQKRASVLGLKNNNRRTHWSDEENNIILNNQNKTIEELRLLLPNKTLNQIRGKIGNDGLKFIKIKDNKITNGFVKCDLCGKSKKYNIDNFNKKTFTCKECYNKMISIKMYKEKYNLNLDFNLMTDSYSLEEWCDLYVNKKIHVFPKEILTDKRKMFYVFKHYLKEYLNIDTKEKVISLRCNDIGCEFVSTYLKHNGGWIKGLIEIFSEYSLYEWDFCDVPKNYWKDSINADKYFKYMVEEYFKITSENAKNEIPKIFRYTYLEELGLSRLNNLIKTHKRQESYCDLFIELYPQWNITKDDFNDFISYDGEILDSLEELKLYEFIKNEKINIKPIKKTKSNTFVNELYNEKYIPDFVIKNDKMKKPIIIEYFGLYNCKSSIYQKYTPKANRKIEYFKSLEDIIFIDLYPEDLKDNFKGVREKLTSFYYKKIRKEDL
jgi:hypothetical protein